MPRKFPIAAVLAAIVIASASRAFAAPQATQQVRPQQRVTTAAPATGTASITVTVTTDDGTGIKGARVTAVQVPATASANAPGQAPVAPAARDGGRGPVVQRQSRTGLGGVAEITDLPAGNYLVLAMPPTGFVFAGAQERVEVKSGGRAAATIRMRRGGVITGRVLDEDGDPVTGAMVEVLRISRLGGRSDTGNFSTQPTNDLGIYRVWGLSAGDYVVGAHFEDRSMPSNDGTATTDGYQPSYFPGVLAFDASRPVQVKGGQETGGVDIQLVRGRMGAVSGRVVDVASGGATGSNPGGSVQLLPRGYNPTFSTRGGSIRPDGTFLITNVPAGEYYAYAVLALGRGPNSGREAGYLPVTVNGEEVSVTIQTNYGATVSGRVILEGTPPAQSGSPGSAGRQAQVRVSARPVSDLYMAVSGGDQASGVVRPDGTFTLTGLRGPVQFTASGGRAALKEIARGASDISGQPIELLGTERIDDLVIVMTYDTGGIQAVIDDDSDQSMPDATAMVVPDDPDKWNAGSPFIRMARVSPITAAGTGFAASTPGATTTATQPTGSAGIGFEIPLLPPGRYLVVALADGGVPSRLDRSAIDRLRESGSTVTVQPGQTATVKVKAIR